MRSSGSGLHEILECKGVVKNSPIPSRLLKLSMATNNGDTAGMGTEGIANLIGAIHAL